MRLTVQEFFDQLIEPSTSFTDEDKAFLQRQLPRIKKRYDQWHRGYHNWSHIEDLAYLAYDKLVIPRDIFFYLCGGHAQQEPDVPVQFTSIQDGLSALVLVILYHDVVYNQTTHEGISEHLSAIFFLKSIQELDESNSFIARVAPHVVRAIKETCPSLSPTTYLSKAIRYIDQYHLLNPQISHLVMDAKRLQHEYRHIPFEEFLMGRDAFIRTWIEKNGSDVSPTTHLIDLHEAHKIFAQQKPTVGVFVLSGNILHLGHWSVIEKAMKMFDRILILVPLRSHLPKKGVDSAEILQKRFPFINIWEKYGGSLSNTLDVLNRHETPVLIKAIRNQRDLEYEMGVIDTVHESHDEEGIYPSVLIPVDAKYRHLNQQLVTSVLQWDGGRFADLIPSMKDLGYTQEELDEMLLGSYGIDDLFDDLTDNEIREYASIIESKASPL